VFELSLTEFSRLRVHKRDLLSARVVITTYNQHIGSFLPFYQRLYENYYRNRNVYLVCGNHLLRTGSVRLGLAMCPDAIALRSESYNDWIAPQKQHHGMLGVIFRQRSLSSMIGAIRPKAAEPFGKEEVSLLRLLIPHLQRAVSLHRKIADLEKQKLAATDALDRWSLGVIVLNAQGRVLLMNHKANEIVSQRDGLLLTPDGLRAALANETSALRRLIHDAIATRLGSGGQSGGALTLSRPSLKRSLNMLVTPLFPQNSLNAQREAAVAVFLSDPEAQEEGDEDTLRRFYGLTPAEAALAGHVVAGEVLKRTSETLQVSMNTAKTHLKRIFEKTGTRRQAELVHLVLTSPAQVRLRPLKIMPHHLGDDRFIGVETNSRSQKPV
jgi:DNA-binding CsgD family transcriptional regulator